MVKFPIINLAFYGAYTVLLALPGTWSLPLNTTGDGLDISPVGNSPRSSLTKRAITVGVTCVGSWGAAVNAARSEALDIVRSPVSLENEGERHSDTRTRSTTPFHISIGL